MNFTRRNFLSSALFMGGMPCSYARLSAPISSNAHSDVFTLDLPKAKKLVETGIVEPSGHLSMADLEGFTTVHPEAIRYLFKDEYSYIFLGVKHLGLELAESFKNMKGSPFLHFNHLVNLQPECARALCEANADLVFGSAKALAKSKKWLFLNLKIVSTEFVVNLMEHKSCVYLTLANEPSYETALQISQYQGFQFTIYDLPHKPSAQFIAGLSSNPQREVEVKKHSYGAYYVESTRIGS